MTSILLYEFYGSSGTTLRLYDQVAWLWSDDRPKTVPRYTQILQTSYESMFLIPKMFNRFVGMKFKIGGSKK